MFRFIQKWHTKFGVFIALFIIILVVTGIALNHTHQFGLHKNFVQNEWLLDFYQIKPASEPVAFTSNNHWATRIGKRLYFDELEIADDVEHLIGLVKTEDSYVVAYDSKLSLFTDEGELIETLAGVEGVPSGMKALGVDEEGNIVIQASHGFYHVNIDELDWKEYEHFEAVWAETLAVPEQLKNNLLKKYRGKGLSLERVLLDVHSGRIAGRWGIYFVDLVAVLFLILAITGTWMWWTRK